MGRLLVQHLAPRGVRSIAVYNRNTERGEALAAEFEEGLVEVRRMEDLLAKVLFTCTGATEPIVDLARVEGLLERRMMMVDISVPRNIDADAALHPLASVFNVDDLEAVVAANQVQELAAFALWQKSLSTVPMISRLQNRAEQIRMQEIQRAVKRLNGLTTTEREVVERLSKGIVNKLLHGPLLHLRTVDTVEERTRTVQSVAEMFGLSDDTSSSD